MLTRGVVVPMSAGEGRLRAWRRISIPGGKGDERGSWFANGNVYLFSLNRRWRMRVIEKINAGGHPMLKVVCPVYISLHVHVPSSVNPI